MASHLEHLLVLFPDIPKGKVLDIGIGDGEFVRECYRRGYDVDGIEINPARVAAATRAEPGIRVVEGRAEALPYSDASFSFINVCEVIEHVVDPAQVLREVRRVLAPDGRVYLSFPNRYSIYDTHYHVWFVNWLPRVWADGFIRIVGKAKPEGGVDVQKLSHMHYYTMGSFKRLTSECGLRARDTRLMRLQLRPYLIPLYFFLRSWYFRASHAVLTRA